MPDDQPRKLFFHGSAQGIECAVNLVNKLLLAAPNLAGKHGAIKKLHSNIVDCPADLVGLLIGKKGWTIKKIQLESGAQISINQSVREGQPRKIIVSGMQASVELATRLIEEVLRNKPDDEDMSELMYAMSIGRVPGSTELLQPQLAILSGGMYNANGQLASEYMNPSSGSGMSMGWEDEQSRHTTLMRGNEALFLQSSYPSVMGKQMGMATLPLAPLSQGNSFRSFTPELRKQSLDFDVDAYNRSGGVDAIFDTRRRSDSEPLDRPENVITLPLDFTAGDDTPKSSTSDEEQHPSQPMRRLSTGSINPAHLVGGLGMGFGASSQTSDAVSSMYLRPDMYARDAEDTIARQLQLKAMQKQRILHLQQEQKEKQMQSLKMQQQQQMYLQMQQQQMMQIQQQQLQQHLQQQHQQQLQQQLLHQQSMSAPQRSQQLSNSPPQLGQMQLGQQHQQSQQSLYFQHPPRPGNSASNSTYTDDLGDTTWLQAHSVPAIAQAVVGSYQSASSSGLSTPNSGSFSLSGSIGSPPGLSMSPGAMESQKKRNGSFSLDGSLFR